MCILVCLHHTPINHKDTRFPSVLNPATGFTVLSPFQDPHAASCPFPCIIQDSTCPWHSGCCRFTQQRFCRYDGRKSQCRFWIKYHHVLQENETFNIKALRSYQVDDPGFLHFVGHFFKTGAELNLAHSKLVEIQQLLKKPSSKAGSDMDSDLDSAIKRVSLLSQGFHYQKVKLMAEVVLAQFAIFWDTRTAEGVFPPRPGREPVPDLNKYNVSDTYLKPISWTRTDYGPNFWPYSQKQWGDIKERIPFGLDPSSIPWTQVSLSMSEEMLSRTQLQPQQGHKSHRYSHKYHDHGHHRGIGDQQHWHRYSIPARSPIPAGLPQSPRYPSHEVYQSNTLKRKYGRGHQPDSPKPPLASCLKPGPSSQQARKRVRFESQGTDPTLMGTSFSASNHISQANQPPSHEADTNPEHNGFVRCEDLELEANPTSETPYLDEPCDTDWSLFGSSLPETDVFQFGVADEEPFSVTETTSTLKPLSDSDMAPYADS
ncbi:hypothetical protein F5Y19DRAFT_96717 [Xylariaceae sp. FL1651]|nr:hypothetical protein F5Y19DRAFT_96717 [Xylariaceae sp. FL1651]